MWWHLFMNRKEAYGVQSLMNGKWGYRATYFPLSKELIEAHLVGSVTLGLPALDENGMSRWCCFDSDYDDGGLDKIEAWLVGHRYRCHREGRREGRAGHLWLFFEEPLPAECLRLFANRVASVLGIKVGTGMGRVEIFPKQDKPNWDPVHKRFKASSIVRLPLGINRKPEANFERGWFDEVERSLLSQIVWLECLRLNPVTPVLDAAPELRKLSGLSSPSTTGKRRLITATVAELEELLNALGRIEPDDYDTWLSVGMALKSGGFDLQIWEKWSSRSPKYQPGICQAKWSSFHGDRRGIGTIFHLASLSH